jgi:hypothetical protein
MFFTITTDRSRRSKFNKVIECIDYDILLDSGWATVKQASKWIFFKGYAEDVNLAHHIRRSNFKDKLGNYCVILYDHKINKCEIKTSLYRTFPISYNESTVTNFNTKNLSNSKQIWADNRLTIFKNFTISENIINLVGNCEISESSETEVIANVDEILNNSISNFVKTNSLPIRVFLTGGLDSTMVYSYVKKFTDDIELITYQHVEYDNFWYNNEHEVIRDDKSYKRIHHWLDKCILLTGSHGDEFMLRNPIIASMFLHGYHGVSMLDISSTSNNNYYQKLQYSKPEYLHYLAKNKIPLSKNNVVMEICNRLTNDYQYHHIGNTITFTPLNNLEIAKQFMKLPVSSLINQALSGSVTRKLIKKNDYTLLSLISKTKDSNDTMTILSSVYSPKVTKTIL